MPASSVDTIRLLVEDFKAITGEMDNPIFRGAPCVIVIHGGAPLGKDNCVAAQHYLMLQAHAMGLATCIIGFAQAAPRTLSKYLDIPRGHKIHAVLTLGYPKYAYGKTMNRQPPDVVWR